MIFRLFLYSIGFGLAVTGGISIIAYLNLLTIGHDFTEYLLFLTRKFECYLLPIGLICIWLSIYWPLKEK
ncbi:hypothetical protein LC040_01355 [Bacillus tianshenii]|nr:hypothetical protein LC040_01355 [Bacillus tianshenii]